MRALYFGCTRGVNGDTHVGHYFYTPEQLGKRTVRGEQIVPWVHVDGKLAPREWDSPRAPEQPQGVAALHHLDGWTALAFWDRSGDRRGNSSSTFMFDAILDFDAALAAAREHFPALFERFTFDVRPTS